MMPCEKGVLSDVFGVKSSVKSVRSCVFGVRASVKSVAPCVQFVRSTLKMAKHKKAPVIRGFSY